MGHALMEESNQARLWVNLVAFTTFNMACKTVGPSNKGHFGTGYFAFCYWEVGVVSFVGRLSFSQRVFYSRFNWHVTCIHTSVPSGIIYVRIEYISCTERLKERLCITWVYLGYLKACQCDYLHNTYICHTKLSTVLLWAATNAYHYFQCFC